MAEYPLQLEEVGRLTGLLLEGALGPEDRSRLEEALLADHAALEYYQDYVDVHCLLHWQHGLPEERGARDQRRGMAGEPASDGEAGFGVRDSGFGIRDSEPVSAGAAVELPSGQWPRTPNPEPPVPTLSTTHYPLPTSDFVGSWAFSYMVATVITGVMLLGFWAYEITHHQHIAEAPSQSVPSDVRPEMVFVGRITGMVDVKWSDDPRYLPPLSSRAYVPLDRKYILDSGLLEITYDSGAKVILQGPCTYEVESTAGGYLSLGKLTARVEKKRSEVRSQRSDHSPLSPLPSPLFSVRTPTAVVTDLGTEFGVEVSTEGTTTSHVFRGLVKVQTTGDGPNKDVVLRANESARVEKGKDADDLHLIVGGEVGDPPKFVRRLVNPPRLLDLLDIVAGGNGLENHRERGIDPVSGMEDTMFFTDYRESDRQFHPIGWHKPIDGVFMPDGRDGSVWINSAGQEFDAFPTTDGKVFGSIWSRAAHIGKVRKKITKSWAYSMVNDLQFMPEQRGLLVFYANAGITFDLDALRTMHPELIPSRFRAVVGLADGSHSNPDDFGQADLWVIVDGQLKFKREKLRVRDGVVSLDVKLEPSDRFLTLAATDGGNGIGLDCVVFGDPVLQTISTDNRKED